MNPWITVIIPTYNRKFELIRCLNSLVNQSNQDFNVVVCDDGSKIPIDEIVAKFQVVLNIKLIRIENSGGPARPRNIAMKYALTEWVGFLDSDDWWQENKLEFMSKLIKKYDFIYHKLKVVDSNTGRIVGTIGNKYSHSNIVDEIMTSGNKIPTSSVIIRSKFIKKLGFDENEKISSYEDVDAWINIFSSNKINLKFVNKSLGYYMLSRDSISKLSRVQISKYLFFYNKNLGNVSKLKINNTISYKNYIVGTQYLNLGDYKKAGIYFKKVYLLKSKTDILKLYFKKLRYIIRK